MSNDRVLFEHHGQSPSGLMVDFRVIGDPFRPFNPEPLISMLRLAADTLNSDPAERQSAQEGK